VNSYAAAGTHQVTLYGVKREVYNVLAFINELLVSNPAQVLVRFHDVSPGYSSVNISTVNKTSDSELTVGSSMGLNVGTEVTGLLLGLVVGSRGSKVGDTDTEGLEEGIDEGCDDGRDDG